MIGDPLELPRMFLANELLVATIYAVTFLLSAMFVAVAIRGRR